MRYLKSQGGFTFLELIATAAFIGVAFVAIVQIFMSINSLNRQSRNLTDAKQIAQEKIEEFRNTPYASISLGEPAATFTDELPDTLGSPRSASIDVTEEESGLKRVNVSVSYTDGPVRNVQLTTFITEEGINR